MRFSDVAFDMDIHSFWAKTSPFQSVYTHALVSGTIAEVLAVEMLSDGVREQLSTDLGFRCKDDLVDFIGYLVSLHDIGKIEYNFQSKDETMRKLLKQTPELDEWPVPNIRHEKTGQYFLQAYWRRCGEERSASNLFAKVVGTHHQGKSGDGSYPADSKWQSARIEIEMEMRRHFLKGQQFMLPVVAKNKRGTPAAVLLGIMILSDWIASGDTFADAESWIERPDAEARIQKEAKAFLLKTGLKPIHFVWPESFSSLWPMIPDDGLRPMQKEMERQMLAAQEKLLAVLIEAPMGEGKTEAGIYAAVQMAKQWGKDGFYIALPTASTANQMVERTRALMEMHELSSAVRLLHSMAWLELSRDQWKYTNEEHNELGSWLAPLKRALLGQYAVGTVDQAMLAATNVKYGVLRLLGLANKALIIDEIHAYDTYMREILVRLLEWCKAMCIPVIMLSATLPPDMKKELLAPYTAQHLSASYPLITMLGQNGSVQEYPIAETSHRLTISVGLEPILNEPEQIAEFAIRKVKDDGCLCVLMNTVKEAQVVYLAIKERYSGDLMLFHSQFPAGKRAEIEHACIRKYGKDKRQRPKQSILVATQVVEQSLDVDFDVMITAVAPIDLLLQRMGRVFRHEDTARPPSHTSASVTVLSPSEEGHYGASAYVYPECLLNSAVRLLHNKQSIMIPEDLAALVRDAYDPQRAPKEEVVKWNEKLIKDEVDAGASQQYLLKTPEKLFTSLEPFGLYEDDGDSFSMTAKTRLGEPTVRIALLPPEDMERLQPFLKTEDGRKTAAVWDRNIAEMVMKRSVSARISTLRERNSKSDYDGVNGAMLLAGTKILQTDDCGEAHLKNGRVLRFDAELGLQIREGEL